MPLPSASARSARAHNRVWSRPAFESLSGRRTRRRSTRTITAGAGTPSSASFANTCRGGCAHRPGDEPRRRRGRRAVGGGRRSDAPPPPRRPARHGRGDGHHTRRRVAGDAAGDRQAPRGPRPCRSRRRPAPGAARCATRSAPTGSTQPRSGWRASPLNGTIGSRRSNASPSRRTASTKAAEPEADRGQSGGGGHEQEPRGKNGDHGHEHERDGRCRADASAENADGGRKREHVHRDERDRADRCQQRQLYREDQGRT